MCTRILGFDPGESYTGWCLLVDGEPYSAGVLPDWKKLAYLLQHAKPNAVVCENYRLYPHKARAQFGSEMKAIRMIGVIEYLCWQLDIEFVLQNASRIRNDPLVKDLKFHKSRHANDAMRHAKAYWLKVTGGYEWQSRQ